MRRCIAVVVFVLVTTALTHPAHGHDVPASKVPASTASASNIAPAAADSHGITVTDVHDVDERQVEYTIETQSLDKPVRIRVVLPSDFRRQSRAGKRYPVLYLYHGTSGAPANWPDSGDLLETTEDRDVITVLPESGYDGDGGGWFVDWWNHGNRGNPQWETYLVEQVTGWVDDTLPTIADREHRAVAGLSQGGFGALHAAARHPDMYASAASFSGAPEIYRNIVVRAGADFIIEAITWIVTPGNIPFSAFGDPISNGVHWAGHDPGTLVENLHDMQIGLWTASGLPGELDSMENAFGGGAGNVIEALTHVSTLSFQGHLEDAGIDHYFHDDVVGTHDFAYWARDLRAYVPMMMDRFDNPVTPDSISYASIEPTWDQWGWTVETNRNDGERFTFLTDADAHGFTFTGRNKAQVTTPSDYQPGHAYRVRVTDSHDDTTSTIRADAQGRLTVNVNLGRALLPADLSFLGLPGRLGTYPDATASVQITRAGAPAPPAPEPPAGPGDDVLEGVFDDVVNPAVRTVVTLVNGLLTGLPL